MRNCLVVLALVLGGCDMYFGGDDDCAPVPYGDDGLTAPEYQLRDPYTGQCVAGGGGGGGCDSCGNCWGTAGAEPSSQPNWAVCYGMCSELDENTCFGTPRCYAAYLDDPATDGGKQFWGCFETAPTGPLTGACANLDGQGCSEHDNCIAIYSGNETQALTRFQSCAPEPAGASCAIVDCVEGYHCEEQCTLANDCKPACVPDVACSALPNEAACKLRSDCEPVYDGQDCTCYPDHCECQILTYESCQAL